MGPRNAGGASPEGLYSPADGGFRNRVRAVISKRQTSASDGAVTTGSPRVGTAPAAGHVAIVGGHDEARLLLRGLLRLHHFQVEREVPTVERLGPMTSAEPGWVLLYVMEDGDPGWMAELALARERHPNLHLMLVAPENAHGLESRARSSGVLAILHRPFGIRDLIATVEAVARGERRIGPSAP
jgi:CheY-like chemotaxis protein